MNQFCAPAAASRASRLISSNLRLRAATTASRSASTRCNLRIWASMVSIGTSSNSRFSGSSCIQFSLGGGGTHMVSSA